MKTKIAMAAEGRQRPANSHEPLSLVSLTRPPLDPLKREEIGDQIWTGIHLRFQQSLSDRDRALWSRPPERPEESSEHLRLLRAFDEFLLGQFAELGWRLLMSFGVLHRVSEWEKHTPDLLSRLGKQLKLRSMVLRGEKCAPFGEDIDKFADPAIKELAILLHRQRAELDRKRAAVSCENIAIWVRAEIAAHGKEFPWLRANLEQLCGFIQNMPKRRQAAARTLERGRMRANSFFYLWYASCSNRSVKDVRNQISRRRSARRSS
jgi:hypothetical protein